MRKNGRLVLASSFPRFEGDYVGAFVARHLECCSQREAPTLICPDDKKVEKSFDISRPYRVVRFPLPPGVLYGDGGPENVRSGGALLYPRAAVICASMAAAALPHLPRATAISAHWALPGGLVGMALKKISGLPLQLILHGGAVQLMLKNLPGRMLLRRMLQNADDIVFVSEALRNRTLEAIPHAQRQTILSRSRIMPMGVDAGQFRRPDGMPAAALENRRILFMGRLVPIKGADVLVQALSASGGDWKLTLAGEGPQKPYIKDLCEEYGVKADFAGAVDYRRRAEMFREHPVFVLPSRRLSDGRVEGAPQALLEAMAAGACIIAADCGGVREMLMDGDCGLLFEPENTAQLADLLNKALQNGGLRRNLGEKAQRAAQKFDWKIIGRDLSATLRRFAE